ncbi:MAG: DUF418 domain-containing protein [Brevundimonas sp.]|nr:DUF418 domain-containing protein [Brevundimonas sp.]
MAGSAAPDRIAALDLVRGVAVLGILAINAASFAGGANGPLSPALSAPAGTADELFYLINFVLFEGKMRGLFTVLFGASLLLFMERRESGASDGPRWQMHRLGWLFVIGYAHQLFLWSGDILMLYAMLAPLALAARHWSARRLAVVAVAAFALWHGGFTLAGKPTFVAIEAERAGTAEAKAIAELTSLRAAISADAKAELAVLRQPYPAMVAARFGETLYMPFLIALFSLGETVPLMLLGMALYRSGFFAGGWIRADLWRLALGGLAVGLPLAMALAWWIESRGFPAEAMLFVFLGAAGPSHLALTLAYAALLVLAAPALLRTAIGARLQAAGQMALSNYLLTSLLMTFVFHGWGLGLAGTVGTLAQWGWVLGVWLVLLAWSAPWLRRYRQGPVEWLWRGLTYRHWQPLTR